MTDQDQGPVTRMAHAKRRDEVYKEVLLQMLQGRTVTRIVQLTELYDDAAAVTKHLEGAAPTLFQEACYARYISVPAAYAGVPDVAPTEQPSVLPPLPNPSIQPATGT